MNIRWFEENRLQDKLRTMKAWSKYSQVLNDPVRSLNMRLTFQNGDITTVHSHHLANVSDYGTFFVCVLFSFVCRERRRGRVDGYDRFHSGVCRFLGVAISQRFHFCSTTGGLRRGDERDYKYRERDASGISGTRAAKRADAYAATHLRHSKFATERWSDPIWHRLRHNPGPTFDLHPVSLVIELVSFQILIITFPHPF